MSSHDDLVSVDVHMALEKGHWLGQNVEAGAHQVNVEHAMVTHHAENTFVIVSSAGRFEVDNDSLARMRLDSAHVL